MKRDAKQGGPVSVREAVEQRFNLARTRQSVEELAKSIAEAPATLAAVLNDPEEKFLQRSDSTMRRRAFAEHEKAVEAATVLSDLRDAEAQVAKDALADVQPLLEHARKFSPGRDKGARGVIRKKIESVRRTYSWYTTEDVWTKLEDDPPEGYYCCGVGDDRMIRRRTDGPALPTWSHKNDDPIAMRWGTFVKTCSLVKTALKLTI